MHRRAARISIVAVLLVSACTSSTGRSGPTSGARTTGSTTASTTNVAPTNTRLPSGVTPGRVPTSVANDAAKRKSVSITTCARTTDGWLASGVAANSGAKRTTFHITVFFSSTVSAVLSFARTSVEVRSGEKQPWTAKAAFRGTPTMLCVLKGVT